MYLRMLQGELLLFLPCVKPETQEKKNKTVKMYLYFHYRNSLLTIIADVHHRKV